MATTRIQFDLDDAFVREIDQKKDEVGITTRKQYFEYSLALLEWALRNSAAGKVIAALDDTNHTYKEISMPPLDRARYLHKAVESPSTP